MGTQFQRLTTPRAWGPEAVQALSAWNLEAHHVFSRPVFSCLRVFRKPPRPGAHRPVWPWQPRQIVTGTLPCALNLTLLGDHSTAVGLAPGASWALTLTLNLNQIGTFHRNLSLSRTLTLPLSRLVAQALTSALMGDHET